MNTMTTESGTPDAPIFAFHEAEFSMADQVWVMAILGVFGALFVALPIKKVLAAEWPPDTGLVVVWLLMGGLIWFLGHGLLWAFLSMRRGEKAGLRVAEGEDYLEVAFFVGPCPHRVQRFAYAEIIGCGVGHVFDALGNPHSRPYVATHGAIVGTTGKSMIAPAILGDARRISEYQSHAIAVDLDRIIRRHCDLPEPAIPLAVIAEEKEREALQYAAQVFERIRHEQALRQTRFLGQDWPRLGMSGAATLLFCVLWLDGQIHLRWDDGSDWLVVGIVFAGFYKLAGALLTAWWKRPQDGKNG